MNKAKLELNHYLSIAVNVPFVRKSITDLGSVPRNVQGEICKIVKGDVMDTICWLMPGYIVIKVLRKKNEDIRLQFPM